MSKVQYIKVTLTRDEEIKAHQVGFKRSQLDFWNADSPKRFDRDLNFHDFITQQAESVSSEMAVAKFLKVEDFDPDNQNFKNLADVGSNIEVKWTRWKDGHLIIYPYDREDDVAVLVVGKSPEYYLVGWIPIKQAKAPQNYVRAQNTYWVTQRRLNPMNELAGSIYGHASL
jgi:hypothetical protein